MKLGIVIRASMFFLFLSCHGCMSIVQTVEHEEKEIYIGTKTDIEALSYFGTDESAWAILGLIDLPFSAVMDTVFLPYTIPASRADTKKKPNHAIKADEK